HAELVGDARDRFALDEVAHELVGERSGWTLVLLDERPLERSLKVQPLPIQLGRGETEADHALDLGKDRREAPFDAALHDQRGDRRGFFRAKKKPANGSRREERRPWTLRDLVEPGREQAAEQLLHHL